MKAGQEMVKHNVKSVLCINHEIGNISLDQREQGFRKILQENNVLVKTIPIDASDPTETQENLWKATKIRWNIKEIKEM